MAEQKEEEEETKGNQSMAAEEDPPKHSHSFVEVICKSTGKTWRFAAGTEAKFAVKMINGGILMTPPATYIVAVKDGEEPVFFGPNSVLVSYGKGWKLQPATEITTGFPRGMPDDFVEKRPTVPDESDVMGKPQAGLSSLYIGKILLVFILMFMIGAVFTLLLESLPQLISSISSSIE